MKIDANMGVVIERPESVLPVELSLRQMNRGGVDEVMIVAKHPTEGNIIIATITGKGIAPRAHSLGKLSQMGFATLRDGSLEQIEYIGKVSINELPPAEEF